MGKIKDKNIEEGKKLLKETPEIVIDAISTGYTKGFLDGINFEKQLNGEEAITGEEFNKMGISNVISNAVAVVKHIKQNGKDN